MRDYYSYIEAIDCGMNAGVGDAYRDNWLATSWARVGKLMEEGGEAVAELILLTGQNPRKGVDPTAMGRILNELADCVVTAMCAIQHFTQDVNVTEQVVDACFDKCVERARREYK